MDPDETRRPLVTQAPRRKCGPTASGLCHGGCCGSLEPCVGRHRDWDPERGEPSAKTGDELHGRGTAAARGGSERPVLGRGRRDPNPGGLRGRDGEALRYRGRCIPGTEALSRRGGHVPGPRPGRREELQRGRERDIFHLLQHPNGCNTRSWAGLKLGARSFLWVSHTGAGAQGLGPSSTAFPDHRKERAGSRALDQKWSSWDSNRWPYEFQHCSTLITCVDSGILRVWRDNDKEAPSDPLLELRVGPGVCRMRQDPARPHVVATGGKENALKVWDLQGSEEPVFRAKNVRNDWLDLRVPIWDQDIQFLPGSQKLVTCTGYHQVRVYDPASPQRRPVLETTYGEYPLTAMTLTPEGNSVIVGNTHGQLAEIDFRQGRLLGCLKGLAGSVRGLQCHPSKPLLASCGLDRVLRIHRIRNPRGLEHKVYLKSRLNCLLLSGRDNWEDEPQEPQEPSELPSEDRETDELWASLEAAAKRKLPDLEPAQGALRTRRRKKKRAGSTSP